MTSEGAQPIIAQLTWLHSRVELVVTGLMFLKVDHTRDIVVPRCSCDVTCDFVRLFFACTCPKVRFSDTQCGFMCSPGKCSVVRSFYPYGAYSAIAAATGKLFAVWLPTVWEKHWQIGEGSGRSHKMWLRVWKIFSGGRYSGKVS